MAVEADSLRPSAITWGSVSKGRILVVDDQPQIRRVLRTTLIAKGYEVEDARGGTRSSREGSRAEV
jgi:DNA-binding NtrC family response regulator